MKIEEKKITKYEKYNVSTIEGIIDGFYFRLIQVPFGEEETSLEKLKQNYSKFESFLKKINPEFVSLTLTGVYLNGFNDGYFISKKNDKYTINSIGQSRYAFINDYDEKELIKIMNQKLFKTNEEISKEYKNLFEQMKK